MYTNQAGDTATANPNPAENPLIRMPDIVGSSGGTKVVNVDPRPTDLPSRYDWRVGTSMSPALLDESHPV